MFLGCGVGAFTAGMFHVMTHAFFKALLFLGAGAVIYAMHHEQDMRKMGGLKNKIPAIYWTMMAGYVAICGVFPFAGLWSKDAILGAALAAPTWGKIYYGVGLATAVLTAFYMSRLMWKTFWSDQRFDDASLGHGHGGHDDHHNDLHADAHGTSEDTAGHGVAGAGHHAGGVLKPPIQMVFPLAVLAVLSVIGGFVGIPGVNSFEKFLEPSVAPYPIQEPMNPWLGLGIGTVAGLLGIGIAWSVYSKNRKTGDFLAPAQQANNPLYQGSLNLWYFDRFTTWLGVHVGGILATMWAWFDRNIIDGIVNLVGGLVGFLSESFRRIQTGYVGSYATLMLLGVVAVVVGLLWPLITK
jgi:NADH-quinone oxidoreductase subunit L